MPADVIAQVSARYIQAYERLTGQTFEPGEQPAHSRIESALTAYYAERERVS